MHLHCTRQQRLGAVYRWKAVKLRHQNGRYLYGERLIRAEFDHGHANQASRIAHVET